MDGVQMTLQIASTHVDVLADVTKPIRFLAFVRCFHGSARLLVDKNEPDLVDIVISWCVF